MAAWAAVLFAFSACQDVVEVEDLKAKDDIPSNGAPEITKIVLANDKEFEIDGADFEDMVRIEGKNLDNVVSVKFNDVEVDPKEIYARYDMLLAPVPRQLPGEVTDMLYITTKNGSVSRPFTVSIPELKIDGLQNEFTNPGDTTVISGDNFDLYGITVEQADVRIGNAICTVIDATRSDITLQIPANAQPNTDLTIQGGEMAEPVAIPYMNTGHQIFDFNDWPGSGGFTHSSQFPDNTLNFLCDGTEGDGYPEPLDEGMKYLRFHGNVGAWGWMVLWAGYIQVPAEVAADPAAYNLCFEVCTNASYPLNSTTRIALGNFMWMPGASGIPVNTYGGWRTMRIGLDEVSENTILPDGCSPAPDNTEWKIVFTPTDAMDFDLSMCNFRFSKKIG